MKKERLEQHLNFVKMCESDKAITRCIERIFEEGVKIGWEESTRCPQCNIEYPDTEPKCDFCYGVSGMVKE